MKLESQDEEGPAGLVPAAYVEPVSLPPRTTPVRVLKSIHGMFVGAARIRSEGPLRL